MGSNLEPTGCDRLFCIGIRQSAGHGFSQELDALTKGCTLRTEVRRVPYEADSVVKRSPKHEHVRRKSDLSWKAWKPGEQLCWRRGWLSCSGRARFLFLNQGRTFTQTLAQISELGSAGPALPLDFYF